MQFPDKARCKQLSLLPLPQGQVKRALNKLAILYCAKAYTRLMGWENESTLRRKLQIKITSTEASNSFTSLR
jgi:hypothetical protein